MLAVMAGYFDSCAIQILNLEEDIGNAKGFGLSSMILNEFEKERLARVSKMPAEKDAAEYNMFHRHRRRGKAVIFNQKIDGLNTRQETHAENTDQDNLAQSLLNLDFEVEICDDLNNTTLMQKLEDLSAKEHSDKDCLLIAVLSHGILNKIHNCDGKYSQNELWEWDHWDPFTAELCPTLAGKPIIFLIQACQGDQLDGGTVMQRRCLGFSSSSREFTECDSAPVSETFSRYTIPNRTDFLMAFSTAVPCYYSWRNQSQGSWFIQSVWKVFYKQGHHKELRSMMKAVSRNVALNFESYVPISKMNGKKQIPYRSTLIRDVYFRPKSSAECLKQIVCDYIMTPISSSFIHTLNNLALVRPTTKPPPKLSTDSVSLSLNLEEACDPPIKSPKVSSPSTSRQTLAYPFDTKKDKIGK